MSNFLQSYNSCKFNYRGSLSITVTQGKEKSVISKFVIDKVILGEITSKLHVFGACAKMTYLVSIENTQSNHLKTIVNTI